MATLDGYPVCAASSIEFNVAEVFETLLGAFENLEAEPFLLRKTPFSILLTLKTEVSAISEKPLITSRLHRALYLLFSNNKFSSAKDRFTLDYDIAPEILDKMIVSNYILGGNVESARKDWEVENLNFPIVHDGMHSLVGGIGSSPIEKHALRLGIYPEDLMVEIQTMEIDLRTILKVLKLARSFSKLAPKQAEFVQHRG